MTQFELQKFYLTNYIYNKSIVRFKLEKNLYCLDNNVETLTLFWGEKEKTYSKKNLFTGQSLILQSIKFSNKKLLDITFHMFLVGKKKKIPAAAGILNVLKAVKKLPFTKILIYGSFRTRIGGFIAYSNGIFGFINKNDIKLSFFLYCSEQTVFYKTLYISFLSIQSSLNFPELTENPDPQSFSKKAHNNSLENRILIEFIFLFPKLRNIK